MLCRARKRNFPLPKPPRAWSGAIRYSCWSVSTTASTRRANESEGHSTRKKDTNSVRNGRNPFVPAGGTGLAKACQYARNEKKYLYRFLDDPAIAPDNNRAENAIRPFVVGRKNWLFSDSEKGAEASAILYSLAATATANRLNVETYLAELFTAQDSRMPWVDADVE